MQANMKSLTAVQLMQEPGILSFIEGSKNTPILDLFVAVKTAYPNLQGSFVDLRAAYNAAKRQAQIVDKEPERSEVASKASSPKSPAPKRRPKTPTRTATLSFDKKANGLFSKMASTFEAPFTDWTQKDLEDINACAGILAGKLQAAHAYRQMSKQEAAPVAREVNLDVSFDKVVETLSPAHRNLVNKLTPTFQSTSTLATGLGVAHSYITVLVYGLRRDAGFRAVARIDSERGRGYRLIRV